MFSKNLSRHSLLISSGYQSEFLDFQFNSDFSSVWGSSVDALEILYKNVHVVLGVLLGGKKPSVKLLKFFCDGQKVSPSSETDLSVSVIVLLD